MYFWSESMWIHVSHTWCGNLGSHRCAKSHASGANVQGLLPAASPATGSDGGVKGDRLRRSISQGRDHPLLGGFLWKLNMVRYMVVKFWIQFIPNFLRENKFECFKAPELHPDLLSRSDHFLPQLNFTLGEWKKPWICLANTLQIRKKQPHRFFSLWEHALPSLTFVWIFALSPWAERTVAILKSKDSTTHRREEGKSLRYEGWEGGRKRDGSRGPLIQNGTAW